MVQQKSRRRNLKKYFNIGNELDYKDEYYKDEAIDKHTDFDDSNIKTRKSKIFRRETDGQVFGEKRRRKKQNHDKKLYNRAGQKQKKIVQKKKDGKLHTTTYE